MKNRRALIFAALCGLLAVVLVQYYLAQRERQLSQNYEAIPVLVAAKNIERYTRIDDSMFRLESVPKRYRQPAVLTAEEAPGLLGFVADANILEGEQITRSKITHPGESQFSREISPDDRACTLAIDEISGVAGLIHPGDHLDIIGTFKTVDEKTKTANNAEAVTILQNIAVLAVGRNYTLDSMPTSTREGSTAILPSAGRGNTTFSNVTVSVSPRQCMDLVVAQQVGVITLSLRSYFNRVGGKTFAELKDKHSTAASVTGIAAPLEIGRRPKWLELRGEQAVFAP